MKIFILFLLAALLGGSGALLAAEPPASGVFYVRFTNGSKRFAQQNRDYVEVPEKAAWIDFLPDPESWKAISHITIWRDANRLGTQPDYVLNTISQSIRLTGSNLYRVHYYFKAGIPGKAPLKLGIKLLPSFGLIVKRQLVLKPDVQASNRKYDDPAPVILNQEHPWYMGIEPQKADTDRSWPDLHKQCWMIDNRTQDEVGCILLGFRMK